MVISSLFLKNVKTCIENIKKLKKNIVFRAYIDCVAYSWYVSHNRITLQHIFDESIISECQKLNLAEKSLIKIEEKFYGNKYAI